MGFFYNHDHKYVVNWHFHNHLQMECDNCFEMGLFIKIFFKIFVLLMKLNTRAIWNEKRNYVILSI